MGFLKRLAFYVGLLLGLTTVAVVGTVVFTYLFTGKLPAIEVSKESRRVELLTPDEVVALIREQVEKAKAAHTAEAEGGDGDGA